MIEDLNVWAAQDALLAALLRQDSLKADEVACELGFPATIEADHVWISGEAAGSVAWELSGSKPSAETFRLSVFVFSAHAEPYADVRNRLVTFAPAVEDALEDAGFVAVVPAWSIPEYKLDAGTDGTKRQLCLEIKVECRCW